jgi:phospho-N-acetylmuramoyl-pentapeptide-transferase
MITWGAGTELYIPFYNGPVIDLHAFYVVFAAFVVVAFGNAVNLTDGLDGLATMPVIIASLAFVIIVLSGRQREVRHLSRHPARARRRRADRTLHGDHRRRPRLPLVQRPAGGGLHGRHRQPRARRRARRDRGRDCRHEIVLGIVGGLFVLEAMSVIIQVIVYKRTGKRVFRWPRSTTISSSSAGRSRPS